MEKIAHIVANSLHSRENRFFPVSREIIGGVEIEFSQF
jgi:hypothetical protein